MNLESIPNLVRNILVEHAHHHTDLAALSGAILAGSGAEELLDPWPGHPGQRVRRGPGRQLGRRVRRVLTSGRIVPDGGEGAIRVRRGVGEGNHFEAIKYHEVSLFSKAALVDNDAQKDTLSVLNVESNSALKNCNIVA